MRRLSVAPTSTWNDDTNRAPRVRQLRRYAGCRLYDPESRTYLSADDLERLTMDGLRVRVVSHAPVTARTRDGVCRHRADARRSRRQREVPGRGLELPQGRVDLHGRVADHPGARGGW
ncbi:hypothetical protein CRT23_25525 [Methylobacterium sp. V23]|nr:hypothetical protein CRT23_25525 [Methylobacterium sp. V23]